MGGAVAGSLSLEVVMSVTVASPALSIEAFEAYAKRLKNHDWFYEYSDDGSVWRAGNQAQKNLIADAMTYPLLSALFTEYSTWIFNGREGTDPIELAREAMK